MSDYLIAAILGVVEGLTEFLPVSSTAHLRISQLLLKVDLESGYWKMFSVVIQLGAILSVVVYFWRRIIDFLGSYPRGKSGQRTWWNHPVALVLLSFVVTAIPCYLIDEKIGEQLEYVHVMGWALIIGAVVMWLVDYFYGTKATTTEIEQMSLKQAIVIGIAQIFSAALPGLSRSMSTIAGGQVMGLSRAAALEFSFFLSIPVMIAASAFKLLQYLLKNATPITQHEWIVLAIGFGVSFLVALGVIAWFMAWVRKHGFTPFAIYRLVAGIATLIWLTEGR